MRTVDDLIAAIEARFPVGESTASYFSVTGEPYVVIGHEADPSSIGLTDWQPGVVRECHASVDPIRTIEGACQAAWDAFELYAKDKTGVLYWRVRPTIEPRPYRVYMRLLISDKSAVMTKTSAESIGA